MDYLLATLLIIAIVIAHLHVHKLPTSLWSAILSFFYRDIHCSVEMPDDNIATIVIANHSNAFIDPFALQVGLNRKLTRTVRADWMQHWLVKWFIRLIGAIPLARFQMDSHTKNRTSFRQLHSSLNQGKWIVIFPEGISHNRPNLKKFKKGAAHIAAEYIGETGKPIRVLQLGIYYSDKSKLNTDIWIMKAGECIYTAENVGIDINAATETWQRNIQASLPGSLRSTEKQKLNWANYYLNALSSNNIQLNADPEFWHKDTQISQLHSWLQISGLDLKVLTQHNSTIALILRLTAEFMILVSGLPIAALGLVLNIPISLAHYLITRYQSTAEDKWASNAYVTGLPLYPLSWLIVGLIFGPVFGLVTALSGLYSLLYWRKWSERKKTMFTVFNCLSQPSAQSTILQLANEAFLPFLPAKQNNF